MLITGGENMQQYWLDTVELFNLESKTSCYVHCKLDVPRSLHSGDGDMVCGGYTYYGGYMSNCYNLISGDTINMNDPRRGHTSWSTASGVYLLGGRNSDGLLNSVEFINISANTIQSGFQLKYYT